LRGFYAGFQSFATPPGASLPSGVVFEQSPGVSLLQSPDFSDFVTTGVSLPSPDFSGTPDVSLLPSPAYIDFEQSLDASPIESPANYAASVWSIVFQLKSSTAVQTD